MPYDVEIKPVTLETPLVSQFGGLEEDGGSLLEVEVERGRSHLKSCMTEDPVTHPYKKYIRLYQNYFSPTCKYVYLS